MKTRSPGQPVNHLARQAEIRETLNKKYASCGEVCVYKAGDPEFDAIASQCTPIDDIKHREEKSKRLITAPKIGEGLSKRIKDHKVPSHYS